MDWQPIDTAPRDGTDILAARTGEFLGVVWFDQDAKEWESDSYFDVSPTHWMPTPQPPTVG